SSDFDRALILVADAFGDICSLSLFIGEGQRIRKVYENHFLDSLGILYSSVTKHLGFRTLYDEGKVMALAGYGDDSSVEEFGGLALNCLLSGRIVREAGLCAVFVPPAPDDSGAVLGAAQAVLHVDLGRPRRPIHSAALGPEYTTDRIRAALPVGRYAVFEPTDVAAKAAELIAGGCIVGWFQGRMEFGPRALGQRSILGDPRRADLHERLNRMKRREAFRPFAPAVLAEHAGTLLRHVTRSPFMSFATVVEPRLRASIPGALHIDGTARFQTLECGDPSPIRRVVEAFHR